MQNTAANLNQRIVVVAIAIAVGLLHFPLGRGYQGLWPGFVSGYLIDILLPFAMFLVFGISKLGWLRPKWARAGVIFAVGAASETMQYFDIPIFGRTFDPMDFVAYAFGLGLGAAFETLVVARLATANPDPVE